MLRDCALLRGSICAFDKRAWHSSADIWSECLMELCNCFRGDENPARTMWKKSLQCSTLTFGHLYGLIDIIADETLGTGKNDCGFRYLRIFTSP